MTDQEFSDDQVKFTIKTKPGSVVELAVETSAELVEVAYKDAVRSVCKKAVLPGFRKGRAPELLVVKNYPNEIDKRWQEEIALASLEHCTTLSRVSPLHRDSKVRFDVKGQNRQSGATLTLTFEVEPTVPSVDPKQFHPEAVKRPEVNEEKVEETIRQLRFFYAQWQTVEGRPVEEKDLVLLDVVMIDTEPARPLFTNTRFEVTSSSMAEWMRELVIGKLPGDSVEGISRPDASLPEEEKAEFSPKKVRIIIKKIEQADLPPLDDLFAQELGVDNVEDLREQVTQLLHHKADAHVQEELRKQASHFLLTHYPFELPHSLIEKEVQFRMNQLLQDEGFRKYWDRMNEEEREKDLLSLVEQSARAVRMFYLCRKILEEQKITVTPRDLPPVADIPLQALMKTHPVSHEMSGVQQAEAFSRLILEKAEDYVIAHSAALRPAEPDQIAQEEEVEPAD